MALQFLGKDPESEYNGSPTMWDDGDCYVTGFGSSAASIAPLAEESNKRPGNSWLFSPSGIQKMGNPL